MAVLDAMGLLPDVSTYSKIATKKIHVRAIFSRTARPQAQRSAAVTFTRRHHADGLHPDCRLRVDWPDDPPGRADQL